MLKRVSDAVYDIDIGNAVRSVSTDLLKPAFFLYGDVAESPTTVEAPSPDQSVAADVPRRPVLRTYARKAVTFKHGTKPQS